MIYLFGIVILQNSEVGCWANYMSIVPWVNEYYKLVSVNFRISAVYPSDLSMVMLLQAVCWRDSSACFYLPG
jgi:hypothetical protein